MSNNINVGNGAVFVFRIDDNNIHFVLHDQPITVDDGYNIFLLDTVERYTPLTRYSAEPEDLACYRYNIPLSSEFFKQEPDASDIIHFIRMNQPDDKRELLDLINQYNRGNRNLTKSNIENCVAVTAVETDTGVLLFDDGSDGRKALQNYILYIGDRFFFSSELKTKLLKIHAGITREKDLIQLSKEQWKFRSMDYKTDKMPCHIDYSKCCQQSPFVLFAANFKTIANFDMKPDYENCYKLHSDFGFELSDRNKKICALSEIAEYGFGCSNEILRYLQRDKVYKQSVNEILNDARNCINSQKNYDKFADVVNENFSIWAKQILEKDFPDRRKIKTELAPTQNMKI